MPYIHIYAFMLYIHVYAFMPYIHIHAFMPYIHMYAFMPYIHIYAFMLCGYVCMYSVKQSSVICYVFYIRSETHTCIHTYTYTYRLNIWCVLYMEWDAYIHTYTYTYTYTYHLLCILLWSCMIFNCFLWRMYSYVRFAIFCTAFISHVSCSNLLIYCGHKAKHIFAVLSLHLVFSNWWCMMRNCFLWHMYSYCHSHNNWFEGQFQVFPTVFQ
jgi:hypothetical protein